MTKNADLFDFYKNISQEQFDEINKSKSLDSFEGEYWLDVKDFEGFYQISNFVRIKSLERKTSFIRRGTNQDRTVNSMIMTPVSDKDGYLVVTLCGKYGKCLKKIHRLFGITFLPNPEGKPEINHIDGIKWNNYPPNLEWNTRIENDGHGRRNGLIGTIGQTNYNSKLTSEDVLKILRLIRAGVKDTVIASQFNVQAPAIYKIRTGRKWSHLTGIPFKK